MSPKVYPAECAAINNTGKQLRVETKREEAALTKVTTVGSVNVELLNMIKNT